MNDPRNHTVLVVDDSPDLLAAVQFALSRLGNFRVLTAEDGIQGLERVVELRPDCVVIDVKMPGLDGYQLVRALRGDPQTAGIPLIILSAMVQPRDQYLGNAAGADQYLTKPLDPQELIDAIKRAITLTESERQEHMRHLADDHSF